MPDADAFDELSPEQAFALLGNETRIAILWAVHESDAPVSFSELRERVGMRDSGQFNYHLDKLAGTFVRRASDDSRDEGRAGSAAPADAAERPDGYVLTFAGMRVLGAILSGTFNKQGSLDPFELDSPCGACGSRVSVEYTDERVVVRCPTCDDQLSAFGFPPGGVEGRSAEDLRRTFTQWIRGVFSYMVGGICPNCTGPMTERFVRDSRYVDEDVGVEFECRRCGELAYSAVGSYVLHHPAVVAFHYDHGIDLNRTPWWELSWLRTDDAAVVAEDPLEVRVVVELDGDELALVVDDELRVSVS